MEAKETDVTLCLGANVAQGRQNILTALDALIADGWSPIVCSSIYPSSSGYLNQIVKAKVGCDYETALAATKSVERMLGRTPEHKMQNVVPIDIDIILWDGKIMRPLDYASEYFRQGLRLL